MTAPPELQLDADVPCLRCGYNLRGLTADGQCPECGHLVHVSVLAWEEDRRGRPGLDASDPRWIRELSEGATLSLFVFALMLVLAFGPWWMYEWRSIQRRWTLGIACTMWVLSWVAAWKLTTRERPRPMTAQRAQWTLRISATGWLLMPFIFGWMPRYNAGWEWAVPVLGTILCGIVAGGAWFTCVGLIAGRAGATVLAIEAKVLACLNVGLTLFVILLPELDGSEDSLSMLIDAHLSPFGPAESLRELHVYADNGIAPHPIQLALLIVPLWSVTVSARLMWALRRAAPRASSSKIA
jgi:hypothetical protein